MTTTINNEHKKLNVPNKREQNQTCLDSAEREGLSPKGNVPNLRFPEFQGEWEKCKLGDIINFSTTRVNSSELNKDNYVSTENMLQDYQGIVKAKSVPEDVNVVSFSCDDILISNIRPYLKKVWKATFNGGCSSDVFVLKANDNIESDYLHYVIANDKFINFVMSGAKGVKMPRGDKKQMETYSLSLPQIQEQHKIARLLSLLDERISTQNKIIDKLQSLIKGIVDCTILRKEKNAIVGDVCSISEQIRAEANIDDIITVRLHGNGVCKSSAENLQLGATQYYRRRAGQLIYGKQNFHNGAIGIVPISLDNGITSKDIPSFDIDEMKCNSVYLLAQLQSPQYYKPAEALTTGTGSKRLKEETFLKMPIVLPNKREQDNIAVLIHRASMNLDHAKRLLELLSIQKQYLLRQMFI